MKRRLFVFCSALVFALATVFVWGRGPQIPIEDRGQAGATTHPEQALIDNLVVANQVLASDELGILRIYGHVSARSQRDPNRYFISRYVAPAFVKTADIIENDLDGNAVPGDRSDEYEERFIDGEIYRARPDVMAIVHTHVPELVAFSVSTVPLPSGDGAIQIYDIRKFNKGRVGEITTRALGRSLAESLGQRNSILLLGHGAVIVSRSISGAVRGAAGLHQRARLLAFTISLGGTIDPNPRGNRPAPPGKGEVLRGGDRAWDHFTRIGTTLAQAVHVTRTTQPSDPVHAIKADLAIAGRILACPGLGIMDTLGNVSARNPVDPSHFFMSRVMAPADSTVGGIVEYDLNSQPIEGPRNDAYNEIYLHGEIYSARPDVMAIVHSHTPEIVAFGQTSVDLRPVLNGATFIGHGLPKWVVGNYNPYATMVSDRDLARSLAQLMGKRAGAELRGHGIVVTDSSLYAAIDRVYKVRLNAIVQEQAILLRGKITYLDDQADDTPSPPVVPNGSGGGPGAARFWEYWKRMVSLE